MKTSTEWLRYYQQNTRELMTIPWELGPELSADERRAIAPSVQEFQLGESSEGRHLLEDARIYSERTGDAPYLKTARLFIAEEQRHAYDLGRFLVLNEIPLTASTLGDRVFRWLRNLLPGLELSIAVLVVGELIAKVYYAALRKATGSNILRVLCEQILRDEVSHVAFQTEQLARLRAARGRVLYAATIAAQAIFFAIAVFYVGLLHRGVLARGGVSWSLWWSACWREFRLAFSPALRSEVQAHLTGLSEFAIRTRSTRSALSPDASL